MHVDYRLKLEGLPQLLWAFCLEGFFNVLRHGILQNLTVLPRLVDDQTSWDLPFPATVLYAGITGKVVAFSFSHGCQASELRSSCLDSRYCTG